MHEKVSFRRLNIFLFFVTCLAIIYSIACQISQANIANVMYGEADYILIPYFAYNLIYQHGHFYDWVFPNAPYFFPDVLVIYLTTLIFKNIYINNLLYPLFQIAFLILVIGGLFKTATKTLAGFRLGIISSFSLLLLFVVNAHHALGFQGYYIGLIVSGEHFSVVLMLFALLWFFLFLFEKNNIFLILLFSLLFIVSGVSDPLLPFYFIVPVIGALSIFWFFKKIDKKDFLRWSFLFLMLGFVSYIIYRIAPLPIIRPISYIKFKTSSFLNFYYLMIHQVFDVNIIVGIIWSLFIVITPFSLLKNHKKNIWIDFILLFLFLIIFWVIFGFMLLHKQGDNFQIRHLQPLIYGPVYIGFPLLLYKHIKFIQQIKNNIVYAIILSLFLALALYKNPPLQFRNLISYYPSHLMCLDEYAKKFHLHAGIGDYWQAKPFTLFNHSGIRLVAVVHDKFIPRIWINTLQVYGRNDFDFALINNKPGSPDQTFKRSDLIKRFGKPTHIVNCNQYTLYVYNNGAMKGLFPPEMVYHLRYKFPGLKHYEQKILQKL